MENLIQKWKDAKQAEQDAIAKRKNIEQAILAKHDNEIGAQLDADYGTGTAKITEGNDEMTLTFAKRVTWEQGKLSDLYHAIMESGDDAEEYIDVKYSVAESKYKAWPEHIRNSLNASRTVKPSSPTFKLKEKK